MAGSPETMQQMQARIVYWGIQGAGKSTNLAAIERKLRSDHRGRLRRVPTPLDPTVSYEVLPIELGNVSGVHTRIEAVAVPGAPEHAPTRKQLLDRADGIVFVIDSRRELIDANLAAFDELRSALSAYGRSFASVPLVIQYNKRDVSDPYALEELHRKLDVGSAGAFEAVAAQGTGVIQALTTVSKQVIRTLRQRESDSATPAAPAGAQPAPAPERVAPVVESAAVEPVAIEPEPAAQGLDDSERTAARAEQLLGASWAEVTESLAPDAAPDPALEPRWQLLEAGPACDAGDGELVLPLVLADADGRTTRLRLRLALEPDDEATD